MTNKTFNSRFGFAPILAIWLVAIGLLVLLLIPRPVHSQVASYVLTWTAPGDDGTIGTATSYDLRYATTRPDTTSTAAMAAWWASAVQASNEPLPLPNGSPQTLSVAGSFITGTTYYFVIRTTDDAGNISGFSNVAAKFTADTIPPAAIIDLR